MTRPDIAAIWQRHQDATPGPWEAASLQFGYCAVTVADDLAPVCDCDYRRTTLAEQQDVDIELRALDNSGFIACAWADVQAMLAYIDELEQRFGVVVEGES